MRALTIPTSDLPVPLVLEAIREIAAGLRPADLAELQATLPGDPADVLESSWRVSNESWLILDREGAPIGVFGVAPHLTPGLGVVWLMGTPGVEAEWLAVARQTRPHLAAMHRHFAVLWNHIDARNELTIRWLEWAGFRMTDAHLNHGPEGRLFYEFARIA